ncbi:MAG TPA: dynamin family protein [Dermatophilaceae bacterium]|nr:dynamin family protein [Dermatophilaceae bacterium]
MFADASEERLDALAGRLQQRRLQVMVAGEAKRGKSTLVNALLGRGLLPTGVTPLTSVVTTVTAAESGVQEHAEVFFDSGTRQRIALARLADFVTEPGNPGNAAGVAGVTVYIQSQLLDHHRVDLVDTPGTGSVYAHNTTDARQALASLDAAILVLTADPPISDAERQLLNEISRTSVRTFVLLNKSDRRSPEENHEAEAFTRRVCSEATRREVTLQSCSARRGHDDSGFNAFSTALTRYLDTRADHDVQLALRGHLTRTLQTMVDSRRVRLRGLELAAEGRTLELKRPAVAAAFRSWQTDRHQRQVHRLVETAASGPG